MTDIASVLSPQARSRRRTRRSLRVLRGRHAAAPAAVVAADVPAYPEPMPEPVAEVAHVAAAEPDRPALGKLFL